MALEMRCCCVQIHKGLVSGENHFRLRNSPVFKTVELLPTDTVSKVAEWTRTSVHDSYQEDCMIQQDLCHLF